MSVSVLGYDETYFETYILINTEDLIKSLNVRILTQSFSIEKFNITYLVTNEFDYGIDIALIKAWWNGVDVSNKFQNLGYGIYYISLDAITVQPGEDLILFNLTISALNYNELYYETFFAVDPETLVKENETPFNESPLSLIITVSTLTIGATIGIAAISWSIRKKRRG